jgi:hypothetical protein
MARARAWLVEHHYLLLRERDIRRLVIAAQRHHEQILFRTIVATMQAERESWVPRLLAPIEEGGISRREWFAAVPSSRDAGGFAEQIEKVGFLKELGADRLVLPDLPLASLEHFAKRMIARKPAALTRIKVREQWPDRRVSTDDQNLDLQRTALSEAGCKRIYEEKTACPPGTVSPAARTVLSNRANSWDLCPSSRRISVTRVEFRSVSNGAIKFRNRERKPASIKLGFDAAHAALPPFCKLSSDFWKRHWIVPGH